MSWITSNPKPHDSISLTLLWLSGPAGGGKTCIQREVAERCKEQGILAASYFFSTRVAELDNSLKFVATIALQLCTAIPGLQPYVEEEIKLDPTLFDKSLEFQFERLIESPLNRLTSPPDTASCWSVFCFWPFLSRGQSDVGPPIPHKVIIIDGLDECRNPQEQIRIIYLLARALAKRSLPLRVAIASRPEYDIRSTFDEPAVAAVTHRIKLEDYGCDADIEDYLIDSLFEIRRKHPSSNNIPSDWPSRGDVGKIVDKASGQFIYASTFLKFVNNPRRDLTEMFDLALNFHLSSPGPINPFTDLDLLYTIVLETADVDLSELKMLLHGIMISEGALGSTSNIDDFFGLNPGTTDRIFCDLHSIIHISPYKDHPKPVQFHHKSLEDYLQASHRSGKFYQPLLTTHEQMLQRCIANVWAWHLHSVGTRSHGISYSASHWISHAQYLIDNKMLGPETMVSLSGILHADIRYFHLPDSSIETNYWKNRNHLQQYVHKTLCIFGKPCCLLCKKLVRVLKIHLKIEAMQAVSLLINPAEVWIYIEESMAASDDEFERSFLGSGVTHLRRVPIDRYLLD